MGRRRRGGAQPGSSSRRATDWQDRLQSSALELALGLPPDHERRPRGRDRAGAVRRHGAEGWTMLADDGRVRRARGLPLPDAAPSRPERLQRGCVARADRRRARRSAARARRSRSPGRQRRRCWRGSPIGRRRSATSSRRLRTSERRSFTRCSSTHRSTSSIRQAPEPTVGRASRSSAPRSQQASPRGSAGRGPNTAPAGGDVRAARAAVRRLPSRPGRLARGTIGWVGSLSALYAASLGLLGLAQWISSGTVEDAFQWGHVAVTGLWRLAGIVVLAAGHRLGRSELRDERARLARGRPGRDALLRRRTSWTAIRAATRTSSAPQLCSPAR